MKKIFFFLSILGMISCQNDEASSEQLGKLETEDIIEEVLVLPPAEKYNIVLEGLEVEELKIEKNQVLSNILFPKGIDYPDIQKVVDQSKDVFDVRKLQAGKKYSLISKHDSITKLQYMVYEIDAIDYIVYDFRDSVNVYRESKPVSIVERSASGIIESSLWNTMMANNLDQELIMTLSDVYAWTIDFYHLQKGDAFKVIYTEKQVEGQSVGVEQILAAEFTHHGAVIAAYQFESEGILDYFDAEGKSLRKAFLRAPVKFSRISSRYTKKRFHPVQKRYKAHLGTDYAAPSGTPIMATGDGVVVASTYKKFNGNYVKIKHNATYTTQYLHMSKRAVNNGQTVKQGDIIGYVGSTGLASGPHVCYRFWKNGKQVDPYRQKLPESKPVKAENMEAFEAVKAQYEPRLNSISFEMELDNSVAQN